MWNKGNISDFLSHWQQMNQYAEACFWLVLDEFESSHMFASQNDFYLCIDLSILPLERGWILLYLLAWKRWMVKNSFEELRGELKCVRTYPDVVKDIHLNITASGTISVLTAHAWMQVTHLHGLVWVCVCSCCQKKVTGDEGWRESETHWAVNGVWAAGSPWHKTQLPRTSLPSSP